VKKKTINQLVVEPESPGRILRVLLYIIEQKSERSLLLKELFENIVKNIITPLITITSQDEIYDIFPRYITPFQIQLKKLIEIVRSEGVETENQFEIMDVLDIKKFSRDLANMIEGDFRNEPEIADELADTIRTYKEYGITLLKNDKEKPDELENVLSYKIDIDDFQKYMSGSILAFFCTLTSVQSDKDTKGLLSIFFRIGRQYNHDLLDYVKTIDLLCNPEKADELKELIRRNPKMSQIIGRSLISNLPIDFKIQHRGQFVAIKYNGEIVAESDTLEQLHEQINRQGIEDDCYIEKIGYSYIAKVEL
jgi:hypothetical protein